MTALALAADETSSPVRRIRGTIEIVMMAALAGCFEPGKYTRVVAAPAGDLGVGSTQGK